MQITLEMSPDYPATLASLGSLGRRVAAAVNRGLAVGCRAVAGIVVSQYLSGQALKPRTGALRRSIDGWLYGDDHGVIGVRDRSAVDKYAWLLGDEQKEITPVKSKFLAVPIGEGLTASGVARYASPREVPGGFFVRSGERLLFGYRRGTTGRGKFRALFVLLPSVLVQGSGALYDGVSENLDTLTDGINHEIDRETIDLRP